MYKYVGNIVGTYLIYKTIKVFITIIRFSIIFQNKITIKETY